MNGRLRLIALFALTGPLLGSAVYAADEPGEPSASPPTLSDRLEQFRRDLIGEPGGAERRAAADLEALREDEEKQANQPTGAARKLTAQPSDARQVSSNAPTQPSAGAKMGAPARRPVMNQQQTVRQQAPVKRQAPAAAPQMAAPRKQANPAPAGITSPVRARLLADWLANPLVDLARIDQRLDAVAELVADPALADGLHEQLRSVYDLERLLARVTTGRASPRDLSFVGRTLRHLPAIKARLAARESPLLARLEQELDLCAEMRAQLERALADDCPLTSREGGFIRATYSAELDGLRELSGGGKQWIAAYQAEESRRSGIPSLKVGFNKVFGYYLEITNAHSAKIPDHYIRKQTVKNAERYITPELKEYEERVLSADEKSQALEYQLFLELRELVARETPRLLRTAAVLAQLDVLVSLADLARHRGYCRPTVVADSMLEIIDGRHPVLDATISQGSFVPNDTVCGGEQGFSLLITGPNMAGKSTFIRQTALITLMAQMGSFVPARRATIGVADRIFARVGASDELARGQSTFMVEMIESARILNSATSRSLVILDEIGRGTSTYDGLSLAWAVVEYLHDAVGCRTLFATHYHELTELAGMLPGVRNYNVAVREWQDQVVFLHKILPGAADKSYGIHVARLAGVPPQVVERAKQILARLEDEHLDGEGNTKLKRRARQVKTSDLQLTLFAAEEHPLVGELRDMELEQSTPMDAMRWLAAWQARLREGRAGE